MSRKVSLLGMSIEIDDGVVISSAAKMNKDLDLVDKGVNETIAKFLKMSVRDLKRYLDARYKTGANLPLSKVFTTIPLLENGIIDYQNKVLDEML